MTWQLACRQCRANFVVEVPFGPKEERELKCPDCGSKDIGRIEGLTRMHRNAVADKVPWEAVSLQ